MKETKKTDEYEPTIADVLEAVQTGFGRHEKILTELQTGFDRHDKILKTLIAGQDNLTERVNVIDQHLTKTQSRVEDVVDMLESAARIASKNASAIHNHEQRITILEKSLV